MSPMCDRWFEDEVRAGLTALMLLMLDRAPPSEAFDGTLAVWLDALTVEHVWHEDRDLERVRTAFSKLGAQSIRWPQPREFLVALPLATQKRLPKPERREPTPHGLAKMAECRALIDEALEADAPLAPALRASFPRRPGPSHYHDGRAAAAGAHLEVEELDPLDPANWPENRPEGDDHAAD